MCTEYNHVNHTVMLNIMVQFELNEITYSIFNRKNVRSHKCQSQGLVGRWPASI